jgi:hypothetical protein
MPSLRKMAEHRLSSLMLGMGLIFGISYESLAMSYRPLAIAINYEPVAIISGETHAKTTSAIKVFCWGLAIGH